MDGPETKIIKNPPLKTHKYSYSAQILLRFSAAVSSLAAAWIMFTNKQSIVIYNIPVDAKYSYSSAFKFLAIANLIACIFSVASLLVSVVLARNCSDHHPNNYYYIFLHDMIVMILVISACSAATAIGFVGRYGNSHTGWVAICDNFGRFCHRATVSITLSYLTFFFYLILTPMSANESRRIHV